MGRADVISKLMGWIAIGLVAGVVTKLIFPRPDAGKFVAPILIGIAGALLGGYLATAAVEGTVPAFEAWLGPLAGAVLLLANYRIIVAMRR